MVSELYQNEARSQKRFRSAWVTGLKALGQPHCFPRCTIWQMDHQWRSWNEAGAQMVCQCHRLQPTASQHQPLEFVLITNAIYI